MYRQALFYGLFAIMLFLSIPALKLGGSVRLGQLAVLAVFGLIFAYDVAQKKLDIKILAFFWIAAVIMTLISLNSIYVKFGESKFFIKYFLIFPAAYYTGYKLISYLDIRKIIFLFEAVLLIYCINAFAIEYLPIPETVKNMIVSYRTGYGGVRYLDYQGTFFEGGWFAMVVEATAFASLLLRYDFSIAPKHKTLFILFYLFVFFSLIMSKNKTIWLAIVFIALFFIVYKAILLLRYTNRFMPKYKKERDPFIKKLLQLDTNKILFTILFFILVFFIVNTLLPEPIISEEMIAEKMQKERGKAFLIVMRLLEDSSWFGGYGFGFVEAYFTLFPQGVIGLGKGSAMIFNSYLDVWLSASVAGLIFHLALVYLSSSRRYYFTMIIPLYFFIFANFNPAIGDEYYYLFMGFSYGVAKYTQNNNILKETDV
jgi:hypothetical protein